VLTLTRLFLNADCLTQHLNKEERKKNLNVIVINVILEHTQKYYLHDIVKVRNIINKLIPFYILMTIIC
jgi:hypothetical protein